MPQIGMTGAQITAASVKEPLINLYALATASHFVQGEARRPLCTAMYMREERTLPCSKWIPSRSKNE